MMIYKITNIKNGMIYVGQTKLVSEKMRGVLCPKRGHIGDKNPMKNPLTVAKMLETRRINRLIKLGDIYGD